MYITKFAYTELCTTYNEHLPALTFIDINSDCQILPKVSLFGFFPSSIYRCSIGHILEHEFFCLGRLGSSYSKGKKVDLSYSEQLLGVVF